MRQGIYFFKIADHLGILEGGLCFVGVISIDQKIHGAVQGIGNFLEYLCRGLGSLGLIAVQTRCVYNILGINAEINLMDLEEKWGKKYPVVIDSWRRNWDKLTTYFRYPDAIRKVIYTTNTIEGYHRQIRKVTKNKGAFTSDMALLKLIYLATERIARKWTMPLQGWAVSASQLKIIFGDRMSTDL